MITKQLKLICNTPSTLKPRTTIPAQQSSDTPKKATPFLNPALSSEKELISIIKAKKINVIAIFELISHNTNSVQEFLRVLKAITVKGVICA
jgi:hypothetical protein